MEVDSGVEVVVLGSSKREEGANVTSTLQCPAVEEHG